MAEQFSLQEIINGAVAQGFKALCTMHPAKITKWDASNQRASCQILVQEPGADEEGKRTVTSWPVISGVPVQFQGAGTYRITCPISDGHLVINGQQIPATTGSLIFATRSLDRWLTGNGSEVDPVIDHSHAPTDCVFMPGLNPFGAALQDVPTAAGSIGFDGGLQIVNDAMNIVLAQTMSNAQYVALSNLVKQRLDTIQSTFDNHTHQFTYVPGTAAPVTTPTAIPNSAIGTLAPVAAQKVKAE